jgi:predicted DNA-binding antitoxin AbrB/MazE fold protein
MIKTIEVIYEDSVFKPISPVDGIHEHEKIIMVVSRHCDKEGLRSLAGTLSHDEAEKLQKMIDEEFGKIEGDW